MSYKQKILLIHNYYKIPGGEDVVVANEKRLLEQHGHEVLLYTRSNQEMDSFSNWQKLCLPFTALFSLRTYREVKQLINKEQPDIVHVHNTLSLVSPSVYYAAFVCGVPVVQTIHNFRLLCPAATFIKRERVCEECVEHGLKRAVLHGCYRNSKIQTLVSAASLKVHRILGTYRRLNYICLTEFNKEKLLQLNRDGKHIVQPDKVYIKPNFVYMKKSQMIFKREYYIYVGRLDRLKGIYTLLDAWKEFPDKKLLICGSGPQEAGIKQYIEKNQMNQVSLLGQLSHEQVLKLMRESKALLMPTLWYEGQPMVILESYAVGTPVIGSDLGNVSDMVIQGVTGLKFKTGDIEDLRTVVKIMEKNDKWDTQKIYETLYSPDKNYEILKKIYDDIRGK